MKKPKLVLWVFVSLLVILCPFSMWAQTWLGTISSDWNIPGNWSTGIVPTNLQIATFNTPATSCTISGNISVGGINITNGYTGAINIADGGTFTVGNQNYVQTGATFDCGNGNFICSNNTFFNHDGGTFISSSNSITLGGDVDFFSQSFNANGGTIVLNSASAANITVDGNNNAAVTLNNVTIDMTTANQPTNNYLLGSGSILRIGGDLLITRGRFNCTAPGHVELSGNFILSQTGTTGSLTSNVDIEFIGGINTTMTLAAGGETLYNGGITLNKTNPANTVSLNSPLTMNNQTNSEIIFIMGKLVTTQANILTIETNDVEWSGASDASFIDGPMIKVGGSGNSGFVFPIGNNDKYAPLVISGANNSIVNFGMTATHSFRAEYFRADPNPTYDINSRDGTLTNIGRCEYWFLDRLLDPGTNANPFVWLSYDNVRSCGISQASDLRVAKWSGTLWNDLGNALVADNGLSFVSTSSIVSSFSPFDLASINAITNPLPITLAGFSAFQQQNFVRLEWRTASENNSDHFTVQRSGDGTHFESVANLPAANNSSSLLNYEYDDYLVTPGRFYYRLKMTDRDGKFVYSGVISIDVRGDSDRMWVFPNPIKMGEKLSLQVPAFKNKVVKVNLTDITGQHISMSKASFDGNGRAILIMNQSLVPGIYIIQVYAEGRQYLTRVSIMSK